MRKNLIFLLIFISISVGIYMIFFQQNKALKYIPKEVDVVVLVDVKKAARQSFLNFAGNPSGWFKKSESKSFLKTFRNSGLRIPDFFQIFHLTKTPITEFYAVLEIKNKQDFDRFLKENKFKKIQNNQYQKEYVNVKIAGNLCIIGSSALHFKEVENSLSKNNTAKIYNAKEFTDESAASVSFLENNKIKNFGIKINEDEIEITNSDNTSGFISLLKKIAAKNHFLDLELDAKNIKTISGIFNENKFASLDLKRLKTTADLVKINDTIITYGYDDDFNEVETQKVQQLVQPKYTLTFQSLHVEKTWADFQNRNWINAENQFTSIPFQPNLISKKEDQILVQSMPDSMKPEKFQQQNFVYLKNTALLSSMKDLPGNGKKITTVFDYIFYGNTAGNYFLKVKFKKGQLAKIF